MTARRPEFTIYVGRLVKYMQIGDLMRIFKDYGRIRWLDIKYDTEMAYAFIAYEERAEAEDAIRYLNNWELNGKHLIVEWAKEKKDTKLPVRKPNPSADELNVCFRCRRMGHWAQDCPEVGKLGTRDGGGGGSDERSRSPIPRSRSKSGI